MTIKKTLNEQRDLAFVLQKVSNNTEKWTTSPGVVVSYLQKQSKTSSTFYKKVCHLKGE